MDKLGVDYRFRTTVETNGVLSPSGSLTGNLILVGRGDPNLSNRKFPFETKEEFDGPPDKVLAELADQLIARGLKQISGDIVGDDSYFPRERYPDGWEIDDMVWEYGAAISAIVVDDNTVTLTLTPGGHSGDPVNALVDPATPDFTVENHVVTSAAKEKPISASPANPVRKPCSSPGFSRPTVRRANSSLPSKSPRSMPPASWRNCSADRGVKFTGKVRAQHDPDPAAARAPFSPSIFPCPWETP